MVVVAVVGLAVSKLILFAAFISSSLLLCSVVVGCRLLVLPIGDGEVLAMRNEDVGNIKLDDLGPLGGSLVGFATDRNGHAYWAVFDELWRWMPPSRLPSQPSGGKGGRCTDDNIASLMGCGALLVQLIGMLSEKAIRLG